VTRVHKVTNLVAVALPPAALVAAIVLLWHHAVGPFELVVMASLYC